MERKSTKTMEVYNIRGLDHRAIAWFGMELSVPFLSVDYCYASYVLLFLSRFVPCIAVSFLVLKLYL